MKTQDLEKGKVYTSVKNENNTYRFAGKVGSNYSFTQFENGIYVDMIALNTNQISYLR